MFSFLDMINHSLGYFNVNSKLKNQVYTVIGFVGDFYLLYVAWRLIQNGLYLRGCLFGLAFIALMYFTAMNIIYYFTNKTTKWDPSPQIEKLLGGRRVGPEEQGTQGMPPNVSVASNGVFANEQVVPTAIDQNDHEKANLRRVVKQLQKEKLLQLDYQGMSDKEIVAEYNQTKVPVRAMADDFPLPYFQLEKIGDQYDIFVGVNEMDRLVVGRLKRVGLTTVEEAAKQYQLFLAQVMLTGGPVKIAGRSARPLEEDRLFKIVAYVAFKPRSQDTIANRNS